METNEEIVATGFYRGFDLLETKSGKIIVVVHGVGYPCDTLDEARKIVDDYHGTKQN